MNDKKSTGIIYRFGKMKYYLGTGFVFLMILFAVYYIFDQTRKQAERNISSGVDEYKNESLFNIKCTIAMEKLFESGLKDIETVKKGFDGKSKEKYVKLFVDGLDVLNSLNGIKEKILYNDFRKKNDQLKRILGALKSDAGNEKNMLYVGYLAQEIMIYIFLHQDKIDLSIDAIIFSDNKEKNLVCYYEDVLSIYDYLKNFYIKHKMDKFREDKNNFFLFEIGQYCKAIAASKGKDDKNKLGEILRSFEDNKFNFRGEDGNWYERFKNEVKSCKDSTFFNLNVNIKPPNVTGRWLQ